MIHPPRHRAVKSAPSGASAGYAEPPERLFGDRVGRHNGSRKMRNERLVTLDHSLQHTSRRVDQVQRGNEKLRQRLDKRNEKLHRVEREPDELRDALESVRTALESARTETEVRQKRIVQLRNTVANLDRELQALRASSSWRLTAPLRRLSGAVKRVKGSVLGRTVPSGSSGR